MGEGGGEANPKLEVDSRVEAQKSSGGAVSQIAKRARVGIVRERSWRMSALSIQTQALFGDDLCFSLLNVVKKVGQRYPDTGVFSYPYSILLYR